MKLLIVFALVAVAFAEEVRVVPLPLSPLFSQPSMGQVIIPNYIIDAIKVDVPVMRQEAVGADDAGWKVHFVDAPLEAEQVIPEPIILGEAPLPAFETAPEGANFVDSVFDVAPVAEEIIPDAVRFVDSPLDVAPIAEEEIIPDAVRFVDSPVEAVRIAEPSLPEVVAPVAEEIIPDAVRFVDSPLDVAPIAEEEIIPDAVRFVDSPVEAVRIAEPSLPEVVAPVAEEIIPEAVRFVDSPLDVEPVKIAVPQYRDYRGKQFDDPMLR